VGVRTGDGLQLKAMPINCFTNGVGIVTRIDTDRALRLFAANHASVLLKCGDRDGFDDHGEMVVSGR
jgi:hypothetical protein